MIEPMKTSAGGRRKIRNREGEKLVAYKDCVGIWTIGCGHTAAAGAPVPVAGMTITPAECDAILARDLQAVEAVLNKVLTRQPTQNQFDAFSSFVLNIGAGGFKKSSVLSRFNRGDVAGAAAAFMMWNKAGGREVSGLTARRRSERDQFMTLDAAAAPSRVVVVPPRVDPEDPVVDPVEMPGKVDAPEPPKSIASSKTAWASVVSGAGGVGGLVAAAQPVIETAQTAKDAANQAAGLFGLDGRLALLIGAGIVIVATCAFIIWDRRRKLIVDGV